jgi:hypothetical protein
MSQFQSPPSDSVIRGLEEIVKNELLGACEPAVEAALIEAEKAIRLRLAEIVMARIETGYSVEKAGDILQIRVNLGKGPEHGKVFG